MAPGLMVPRSTLRLLATLAVFDVAARAHAEPLGSHQPHIEASLGVRASKVADQGFDPFANSDELVQVSLGVGGTVLRFQPLSLAAVGFWDYGERGSQARGAETSLAVHRLSVGPELRYHLRKPLYVFAHALPAFAHSKAALDDSLTLATRTAKHWSYGADFALGAAFEVYGMQSGDSKQPRIWAIAEGGYGYLGATKLRLEPQQGKVLPSAPRRSTWVRSRSRGPTCGCRQPSVSSAGPVAPGIGEERGTCGA